MNLKKEPKAPKAISDKDSRVLPEVDTMGAAATVLGCSVSDLKWAKKQGCPGFGHGRVKPAIVREWFAENPPPDAELDEDALKRRKLLAQCRKLELDEAILRGEYTDNAQVTETFTRLGEQSRAEWLLLPVEAPLWAGLSAAEIEQKAMAFAAGAIERIFNGEAKI